MNDCGDSLEEGEIVDDLELDLEDISSENSCNSSAVNCSSEVEDRPVYGKLNAVSTDLRAVCLRESAPVIAADAGPQILVTVKKRKKHMLCCCGRRPHYRPPRTHKRTTEGLAANGGDLKEQFKKAVQISDYQNTQHLNSLRDRLNIQVDVGAIENVKPSPSPVVTDDNVDEEDLRLEALRSAVLNKCHQRKLRKELEEKAHSALVPTQPPQPSQADLDEDEDVLRATLLAAVSKNIVKKSQELSVMPVTPPRVQPLIIQVNGNSTSEDCSSEEEKEAEEKMRKEKKKAIKPQVPRMNSDMLSKSVDAFLREQRAQIEQKESSDNMTNNNNSTNNNNNNRSSLVKLMPQSQQLEYITLVKKLKVAELTRRRQQLQRNLKKTAAAVNGTVNIATKDNSISSSKIVSSNKQSQTITAQLSQLQRILKEIKMPAGQNGSLQSRLKKEYLPLLPLLKQINTYNSQRRNLEDRIRKLTSELEDQRQQLNTCHSNMSQILSQIISTKQNLERIEPHEMMELSSQNETAVSMTMKSDRVDVIQKNDFPVKDPNDIVLVAVEEQPDYNNVILQPYVSPLNHCNRSPVDPQAIMCPFEINGSCRDTGCSYKHYFQYIARN